MLCNRWKNSLIACLLMEIRESRLEPLSQFLKLCSNLICCPICLHFRGTLLTECWRNDPLHRPDPDKIRDLLIAHATMVSACLDSPMSSVATDENCVGAGDIRRDSVRTWRGTPSPSLRRSRTITQLTQEQIKILMPHRENGVTPTGAV